MKQKVFLFVFATFVTLAVGAVEVLCTLHPYSLLVQDIAGEYVQVKTLISPGRNPHNYSPTVSDVKKINDADMIIANGLHLETMVINYLEQSKEQGRNIIWSSRLIPQEVLHQANRECHSSCSHNHSGSSYNPHIWLHPEWVRKYIIPGLTDIFVNMFPDQEKYILKNADRLGNELYLIEKELQKDFSEYEGSRVIINHPSFFYFWGLFNIEERALFSGEETQPSVRTLQDIILSARNNEVRALFYEKQFDRRKLELLASETGLSLYELNPLGSEAGTFIELYQQNILSIKRAFDESK